MVPLRSLLRLRSIAARPRFIPAAAKARSRLGFVGRSNIYSSAAGPRRRFLHGHDNGVSPTTACALSRCLSTTPTFRGSGRGGQNNKRRGRVRSAGRGGQGGQKRRSHNVLDRLLDEGKNKEAWGIFYDDITNVRVKDVSVMLKACHSSEQQMDLIKVAMRTAGVKPNVVTFTTMVNMLMMEGDVAAARRVVEKIMAAARVEPDERIREALELPASNLSKMRTAKLSQWLKQGGDAATAAAWALLEKLVEKGVADEYQFAVLLKACHSSEQTRGVIEVMMPKAGVKPNAPTFNTLVSMLMMEGDMEAARRVVEEDMPAAGVAPNERTREALELPEWVLSKRRTAKLSQWLKQGGDAATAAAWALLEKLVEKGVASEYHFNVMIKACHSSEQQRDVIEVMMPKAGVKPNAPTFNTLVNMVMIEGDTEAARRVVADDMPAAGVVPNERTREAFELPDWVMQKRRNATMQSSLAAGNAGEIGAIRLLLGLHRRELANAPLYKMAIDHLALQPEWEVSGVNGPLWLYRLALEAGVPLVHSHSSSVHEDERGELQIPAGGHKGANAESAKARVVRGNLHGATRGVAQAKTADLLLQIHAATVDAVSSASAAPTLELIVGKGKGSGSATGSTGRENNATKFTATAPVVKRAVQSWLRERLRPPLNATEVPGNAGRLQVSAAELGEWCRGEQAKRWMSVVSGEERVSSGR